MFLVALAAAAASPHSITGAFGYVLGEIPKGTISSCEKTEYPADKAVMFACPGDRFFKRIYVDTHRSRIEFLSGSRSYTVDSQTAQRACIEDLDGLKKTIEAKYPNLLPAWTGKTHGFRVSETVVNQRATGRRIEGWCAESTADNPHVVLWLSYSLGNDEIAKMINLDETDEVKSKGLDPDKL